ncbi:TPA: hypothetical protein ACUE0X_005536, partial [Klebsiella pneumoniae]|nr:hypothetical protein [Salmonella enterica]EBQ6806838.1 hypothetical protein [Salmonella enterica]EFK4104881.1 hypothetical protein [Escherichia coli]EJN6044764.1 hypothetical protein [Salmonella enterica]
MDKFSRGSVKEWDALWMEYIYTGLKSVDMTESDFFEIFEKFFYGKRDIYYLCPVHTKYIKFDKNKALNHRKALIFLLKEKIKEQGNAAVFWHILLVQVIVDEFRKNKYKKSFIKFFDNLDLSKMNEE